MPTKTSSVNLNATSVDILNAIRNSASANYRDYVPVADRSTDSIREIGNIIMDMPILQNEFLSALVNRIGMVMISSKLYSNPWSVFKRGTMELGETIEEIFVNIAKPFEFDPAVAETNLFKRETPDVRSAFHFLNYRKFYKTTVSQDQLRMAFLNWSGITNLVSKITEALYTAANYDEFLAMKYLLAKHILHGELYPRSVDPYDPSSVVKSARALSNQMEFMKTDYNLAGVHTYTLKESQYIILDADYAADIDVDVLAVAFNMSKAEFMGHVIYVDSFGALDPDRLDELFSDCDWYTRPTDAELEALKAIPAVLVDKDFFVIVDVMQKMTEQHNAEGLYWNYFYHCWKTLSCSPFANAAVFVPGIPAVTGITCTPSSATVYAGQTLQIDTTVDTENFASMKVVYESSDETVATVDIYGEVKIAETAESGDSVTITVTSLYNPEISTTVTLTVG